MKKSFVIALGFCLFWMVNGGFSRDTDKLYADFEMLPASSSNYLISQIGQSPMPENLRIIASALNRVRDLRITEARVEVRKVVDTCVPSANQNHLKKTSHLKILFYIAVRTLGEISRDENDAATLASYYRELNDSEGRFWIVYALGQMEGVKSAVVGLNDICELLVFQVRGSYDERLINCLLDGLETHNSRTSLKNLMVLQSKIRLSRELDEKMGQIINKLSKANN